MDPASRTARVEPGATLADLDAETQAFGLATPLGHQLHHRRGRAHPRRRLRLAEPQARPHRRQPPLRRRRAGRAARWCAPAQDENADLFWALRGGGGNFGVVTSFEFRLHPVGPAGDGRPHRPPLLERQGAPAGLPARGDERAGGPHLLGGDAQGAAAAVPAAGGPRQGGPGLRALLHRGSGAGAGGARAAQGARAAHRGGGRPDAVRRLAARLRPAPHPRAAQLLEVP